ncbi:MAG: FAD:protein FMN transferase [Lachnospiraceae bacterium]|nr:FAD:protein FMN transferase [Lachnospiraceae bacterium]
MSKKLITLLKMIVLALGVLTLCIVLANKNKTKKTDGGTTYYDFAMGTSVSVTLYGASDGDNISDEIIKAANSLSEELISWRTDTSELGTLNQNYVAGQEYSISEKLHYILYSSYEISEKSNGAMDITIRPLADVWNIESADSENFKIPNMEDIAEARANVGYEYLEFTDNGIILQNQAMILDLGSTGKGYALDIARDILNNNAVDGAVVTMGGSILVYGKKTDGSDWKIGIRDPEGSSEDMIGYLSFSGDTDICISTSGDYEKYIEKDGVVYHHILDRETGYPSNSGLRSVTVVCENGLISDGLSTACFVLGYDASLKLLEEYDAEAVFVLNDNQVIVTEGLKDIYSDNN